MSSGGRSPDLLTAEQVAVAGRQPIKHVVVVVVVVGVNCVKSR